MSRRQFGRIRQLPSGRWQARYALEDGELRTAPRTFPTKGDAARYLASVETDLARATVPRSTPRDDQSLGLDGAVADAAGQARQQRCPRPPVA